MYRSGLFSVTGIELWVLSHMKRLNSSQSKGHKPDFFSWIFLISYQRVPCILPIASRIMDPVVVPAQLKVPCKEEWWKVFCDLEHRSSLLSGRSLSFELSEFHHTHHRICKWLAQGYFAYFVPSSERCNSPLFPRIPVVLQSFLEFTREMKPLDVIKHSMLW